MIKEVNAVGNWPEIGAGSCRGMSSLRISPSISCTSPQLESVCKELVSQWGQVRWKHEVWPLLCCLDDFVFCQEDLHAKSFQWCYVHPGGETIARESHRHSPPASRLAFLACRCCLPGFWISHDALLLSCGVISRSLGLPQPSCRWYATRPTLRSKSRKAYISWMPLGKYRFVVT